MSEDRELIEAALGNLLEPIVAMLLRNGVTYKDFAAFSKGTYVAVAERDFGIRGRPTNTSRIAAMTGLDRKDVKQIRDALAGDGTLVRVRESQDKMSRVVRGWHEDKDFLDAEGKPVAIPQEGEGANFKELARRYSSGLPAVAVLKELLSAGCVAETEDGLLQVLKPYYSPQGSKPEALLRAGTVVNELASTLLHNLYIAPEKKRETPRFERRVSNNNIHVRDIPAFKLFLEGEGQAFMERIAQWLNEHHTETDDPTQKARVGVGLYGIERKNTEV